MARVITTQSYLNAVAASLIASIQLICAYDDYYYYPNNMNSDIRSGYYYSRNKVRMLRFSLIGRE